MTTEEETDLGIRAQNGDVEAQNKLIVNNLALCQKIAHSYRIHPDIAQSIGTLGILKAIHYFKPEKGRFGVILGTCVRQSFYHYMQWRHRNSHESLDAPVSCLEGEKPAIEDVSDAEPDPGEEFQKKDLREVVPESVKILSSREREYVERHFGLNGYSPESYLSIGRSLGCTHETVRLVVIKALKKLRKYMEGRSSGAGKNAAENKAVQY